MKNIMTVICVMLALGLSGQKDTLKGRFGNGGASSKGTTIEEYNYITKGYKIQIESGLDMKKGYTFKDLLTEKIEFGWQKYTMNFKGLYRDGEQIPCAIMANINGVYLCVPQYESDINIWNMYLKLLNNYDTSFKTALSWGTSKTTAFFAQNN
jgi:hypothetical protein